MNFYGSVNPVERNTFTIYASFEDPEGALTVNGETFVQFECAAGTVINDADTAGLGAATIIIKKWDGTDVTADVVESWNGVDSLTLSTGTHYLRALSTDGKDAYYKVSGGLDEGEYLATIYLDRQSSDIFHPRLTARVVITVEKDPVRFTNP